jgi:23S rRNA (guanine1835-N2)-methyltransferase
MVMEQVNDSMDTSLKTAFGPYHLLRYPVRKNETLRAWDAADEYILDYLEKNDLLHQGISLLILNDNFGGLSIPLNQYQPVVMTDSFLSMQGISLNLKNNNIDYDSVTMINSLHAPGSVLDGGSNSGLADIVLIKVPKSLAMLEDQLHRIRSSLSSSTIIIAAGMTKHIHNSTMELFEKIIGPTRTSIARKKARLIFSQFDENLAVAENPYPQSYQSGYKLGDKELEIINHAGVFSRDKLDIGARLFIENMPVDERYKTIVDLGCGNGVLGLIAAIKNPAAKMIFTDESYMAIESSITNFMSVF